MHVQPMIGWWHLSLIKSRSTKRALVRSQAKLCIGGFYPLVIFTGMFARRTSAWRTKRPYGGDSMRGGGKITAMGPWVFRRTKQEQTMHVAVRTNLRNGVSSVVSLWGWNCNPLPLLEPHSLAVERRAHQTDIDEAAGDTCG